MLFLSVFVNLLFCISLQLIASVKGEIIKDNSTTIPNIDISICSSNDTNSLKYCNCSGQVISCDFRNLLNPTKTSVTLKSSIINKETELKRLCICGTHKNVNLVFDPNFLNPTVWINQLDLYQLDGNVDTNSAFLKARIGSIFMSDIRYLNSIESYGFGFGYGRNSEPQILNLNANELKCCSNIAISGEQNNLKRPLLYIDNVTIGRIYPHGIDDRHRWENVILQNLKINKIHTNGIQLNEGANITVHKCSIEKAQNLSMIFSHFQNFVLSESNFSKGVDSYAFGARSSIGQSTILIVGNTFLNSILFELDAQLTGIWHNKFNLWDDFTFLYLNTSKFANRRMSIAYNTVKNLNFPKNSSKILQFPKNGISFDDNILSKCNCSISRDQLLPQSLISNENDCRVSSTHGNDGCYLSFEEFNKKCKNILNFDISHGEIHKMCSDKKTVVNIYSQNDHTIGEIKEKAFHKIEGLKKDFISNSFKDFDGVKYQVSDEVSAREHLRNIGLKVSSKLYLITFLILIFKRYFC